MNNLPKTQNLNIASFSAMFKNVTNSYKFYFFLGVLENLRKNGFCSQISFDDLRVEMLSLSWYSYKTFHLSFGGRDQLTKNLDKIGDIELRNFIPDYSLMKNKIIGNKLGNDLLGYVPYRLIRPFFADKLRGSKDAVVNSKISEYSKDLFLDEKPFYKILDSGCSKKIVIHDEWLSYIKTNYGIIKDWLLWNLLEYMQKQNPNVPNLSSKLLPPTERDSLNSQRKFWFDIIKSNTVRCVFSDEIIEPDNFSLDHYLPWSFVGHDRLWNLVPISREVNSSKSNNLPSDIYLEKFIDTQHFSIIKSEKTKSNQNLLSCYLTDLFIQDFSKLEEKDNIKSALEKVVLPAIDLGSSMGFSNNWKYKQEKAIQVSSSAPVEDESKEPIHHDFLDIKSKAYKNYLPFVGKIIANPNSNAGFDIENLDNADEISWFNVDDFLCKEKRFVIQVVGDSMEPTIDKYDYVVCEYHRHSYGKEIVLVQAESISGIDGSSSVKRLKETKENWIFQSDNKKYEDIIVSKDTDEGYPIIGEVVYNLSKSTKL